MPKTNEKDAYYFPHDCNARNDPKILALRSVFGAEGYGRTTPTQRTGRTWTGRSTIWTGPRAR